MDNQRLTAHRPCRFVRRHFRLIYRSSAGCGCELNLRMHATSLVYCRSSHHVSAPEFNAIRNRLIIDLDANLTDLDYEFGYNDQAHFINDFKAFADFTLRSPPWNAAPSCRKGFVVCLEIIWRMRNRIAHIRARQNGFGREKIEPPAHSDANEQVWAKE